MTRIEINVLTGEIREVELTPEEIAALPPPGPPDVPQSVSRRQGKQALRLAGKLPLVQSAIDAISDPLERGLMQDWWDDSTTFERAHPAVISLAPAIGLDDPGLDALFIQAAGL